MNNECQNCDSKICAENGCIEERSPREFTDPYVVMVSTLLRAESLRQMSSAIRIYEDMKRLVEILEPIVKNGEENPYLLYKSLSEEVEDRFNMWEVEDFFKRIESRIKEYNDSEKKQNEMNRVRLSLVRDVDFDDGGLLEELIHISMESAEKSKKRFR
jgi:hypothetical protein